MALRKPLVINSGEIQQLQSGDTLDASIAELEGQIWENGDVGNHVIGDVVYISDDDTVKKAKADAGATTNAIGVATATISSSTTGVYQTSGVLAGLTGLTAGAVYYLSAGTAGAVTATPPSSVGEYVVRVGIAVSTTELDIQIERAILL